MKYFVVILELTLLTLFNVSNIHADTIELPVDDSYVEGVIAPLETEHQSEEENEIQVYTFILERPEKVSLHFISHIKRMRIQIRDFDEYKIIDEILRADESPYDYNLVLEKGQYTLYIIKIAPMGAFGLALEEDNIGDYKLKINTSSLRFGTSNDDGDEQITVGNKYGDYFTSRDGTDTISKTIKMKKLKNGTYTFHFISDMAIEFEIININGDRVYNARLETDYNKTEEVYFDSGMYDIVCKTKEAGSFQIAINPGSLQTTVTKAPYKESSALKETETIRENSSEVVDFDEGIMPQGDIETKSREDREERSILDVIISFFVNDTIVSTVIGYLVLGIIITVVGGLILSFLKR